MKNKKVYLSLIIISLVGTCVTGCFSFKYVPEAQRTDMQQSEWDTTLRQKLRLKPVWIVHDTQNVYYFVGTLHDTSISGAATITNRDFKYLYYNNLMRRHIPKEQKSEVKYAIHLYTYKNMAKDSTLNFHEIYGFKYVANDLGANIAINALATVAGSAVVGVVALAIICNCPRVYSYDDAGNPNDHGTILTGAISKSLSRTDKLWLDKISRKGNTIDLSLANELPEVEYIDGIRLLKTKVSAGYSFGVNNNNSLFEFKGSSGPIAAVNGAGINLLEAVAHDDNISHDCASYIPDDKLYQATFTFHKPTSKSRLIFKLRQSDWMEKMAAVFFESMGSSSAKWMKRIERVPAKRYMSDLADRGISMRVWMETDKGWKEIGVIENIGRKEKYVGIDLDLNKATGSTVRIKVECAYKFWEINYVAITNTWNNINQYETVPMQSAVNEKGDDVFKLVSKIDRTYAVQPNKGSFIKLAFTNTATDNEEYVLEVNGYYYHTHNSEKPENEQLMNLMKPIKGTQRLSVFMHLLSDN